MPSRFDGEQDFEALEQAVRRKALALAARAVEERLNADRSDHDGPAAPCARGQTARYVGRRAKTFRSVLGPLRLERAWYHCDACQSGWSPRDRALGLQDTSLSPGATRMVGLVAAEVSFAKADELLAALAGVPIDAKQVERTAEALGREVAADERAVTEAAPAPAPTMCLGLDGAGVPLRPSEVEDRRGKQTDGTARTREVKLAVVWTAEARDRDPLNASFPDATKHQASACDACPETARGQSRRFLRRRRHRRRTELSRRNLRGTRRWHFPMSHDQ